MPRWSTIRYQALPFIFYQWLNANLVWSVIYKDKPKQDLPPAPKKDRVYGPRVGSFLCIANFPPTLSFSFYFARQFKIRYRITYPKSHRETHPQLGWPSFPPSPLAHCMPAKWPTLHKQEWTERVWAVAVNLDNTLIYTYTCTEKQIHMHRDLWMGPCNHS